MIATSCTRMPTRSTSMRNATFRNCSAQSSYVARGMPASSTKFQQQWLMKTLTARCARISAYGTHRPTTTMSWLDARSLCCSAPSAGAGIT